MRETSSCKNLRERRIARSFSYQQMKIPQQLIAGLDVVLPHRIALEPHVLAELCEIRLAGRLHEACDHRPLDHPTRIEELARFSHRRLRDESASARLQRHQLVGGELMQRLAHLRAADAKELAEAFLDELSTRARGDAA